VVKLLILAGAPLLAIVFHSPTAAANGDAFEIFRGREGSYEVVVAVLPEAPAVGTVHFSITPLDAGTLELVADAQVVIVATHESGEPAYQARALNSPASPRYYETNLLIEEAGEWTLSLTVTSDRLGRADFQVPLTVQKLSIGSGVAGGFVFLVVLFVLAGGSAYLWRSARGRRSPAD
jgi:hypothetical protein